MVLRVLGTGRGLTENPAATGYPSSLFCGADPHRATEAHTATAGTKCCVKAQAGTAELTEASVQRYTEQCSPDPVDEVDDV